MPAPDTAPWRYPRKLQCSGQANGPRRRAETWSGTICRDNLAWPGKSVPPRGLLPVADGAASGGVLVSPLLFVTGGTARQVVLLRGWCFAGNLRAGCYWRAKEDRAAPATPGSDARACERTCCPASDSFGGPGWRDRLVCAGWFEYWKCLVEVVWVHWDGSGRVEYVLFSCRVAPGGKSLTLPASQKISRSFPLPLWKPCRRWRRSKRTSARRAAWVAAGLASPWNHKAT